MRFVTTERAQPGMVLASPVVDRRGRLLIPAAACLTERHIEALHLWGIAHVDVEGVEPQGEALTVSPADAGRITREVEALFAERGLDHPFMDALRRCAIDRRTHAVRSHGSAS